MHISLPPEPTQQEIDAIIDELAESIRSGTPPHHTLEYAGTTSYRNRQGRRLSNAFSKGVHTITEPFLAIAPYIATDIKGRIHWMHPVLRQHLDAAITRPLIQRNLHTPSVVASSHCTEAAIRIQRAWQAYLSHLDKRHCIAERLRQTLLTIPKSTDAAQHHTAIAVHIEEAETCPIVGWNLLRLHTPLNTTFSRTYPHTLPGEQADILAHHLSSYVPAPAHTQALAAYAALRRWGDRPGASQDIATVAAAMRHGVLPPSMDAAEKTPTCALAVLLADLADGDIARRAYDDANRLVAAPPAKGRQHLAFWLGMAFKEHAFSAHQILMAIQAANTTLQSIGEPPTLTLDECFANTP